MLKPEYPPCILLDARNLTDTPAGVGNYAKNLIPRLVEQAGDAMRWIVIRHESNLTPLHTLDDPSRYMELSSPHNHGDLRDFALGSADLHKWLRTWGPVDIVHDLFHISPFRWFNFGPHYQPKFITTLHDFIWIDHPLASQPTLSKALWVKTFGTLSIPHTIYHSDHVICVSEATRERASLWLDPGASSVIAHGVHPSFFEQPPALPETLINEIANEPYICCVSNDKRYKNVDILLQAFAAHRRRHQTGKLVLVGKYQRLRHMAAELGISDHVVFTGILNQDQMHAVVAHGTLFVFPSLVEGFGLPPLEAMACGVPTAIADIEPMRSIADSGAMRFDPHNPEELGLIISRQLQREDLHQHWKERAQQRARQFTWERCAQHTLDVYRNLLT